MGWDMIGTGLTKFNDLEWIHFDTLNSGLPSDWIITLASDQLGNMWIGTDGGGLAVFNENGIVSVDEYKTFRENFPNDYKLNQNYPNPFNPTTKINYELPTTNYVDLSIYNMLGQKVVTLVSEKQNAGNHQVEWDASGFASGVYYYRIEAGEFV
jgi:hypothetical protein